MTRNTLPLLTLLAVACAVPTEGIGDETDTGTEDGDEATDDGLPDLPGGDGDGDGDSTSDDTGPEDSTDTETGDGDGDAWEGAYALWRFDGDLEDAVGDHPGADPSGQVEFVTLEDRQGAVFGDTGYVTVGGMAQTVLGWDEWTIAVRVHVDEGADKQAYVTLGAQDEPNENPSENGFGVWLFGGVQVYSETANATDQWLQVGPRPAQDAWHTLVWTFSQDTVTYYANGAFVSQTPYTMSPTMTTSFVIGGWHGYHPLAGVLDQVALYDRVLAGDEVLALEP